MTPTERASALQTAARLIRSVARSLNDRSHTCPTCGLNVKEAWSEAVAREQLESMERKLERLADMSRQESQ